jgi:acyl-CoA synthetase (AMP-forming)/AMP-acid ligase II
MDETVSVPPAPAALLPIPERFWTLFAQRAAATPDLVMLRDEIGRVLTFAEVHEWSERVASGLLAAGIRPGSRVAWQLPTSVESVVLMAALARLDVTQNLMIPILRHAEVDFIVGQSRPATLLVRREWRGFDHAAMAAPIADAHGCALIVCESPDGGPAIDLPLGSPDDLPPAPDGPDDVRWIFYSSGTTGVPKGVLHTDRSVMATPTGAIERGGLTSNDVFSIPFPIAHVGGPAMIAAQLRNAMTMLLFSAFDPQRTPAQMASMGLTIPGSALPFFQAYLARQAEHPDVPLFPKARVAMSGGSHCPAEIHHRMKAELGVLGVISVWGLTEAPMSTCAPLDAGDDRMANTVGPAAPGVTIRVVDREGRPVPPGVVGQLVVRGPQMLRGYVDPALDADAFDDEGFFRSGDLGVMDEDGYIRVTGRLKDIIIRNGENVSAAEVERVLFGHPAIADVAVIGIRNERTGERCCAVVVPADAERPPSLGDLVEHCRAAGLAAHKFPEQIEIVDALPRNAPGKILKHELVARFDPGS